jgi:hypothetical protein
MSKWLDYPGCGSNRPSIMWDSLTALQQVTVKEIQSVLFLCKLPRHIRNLINPREFQEPEALIQRCNERWEDQSIEEAAAAAATATAAAAAIARPHSPFRDTHRSSSLFREGARRRQVWPLPLTYPWPDQRWQQRPPVFLPLPLRFQGQEKKKSARRAALTRKTNRPAAGPYTATAAGPIQTCCPPPPHSEPASATAMSFLPAKNLIFLQDTKNYFKFLVDSGASLSILPHSGPAPPTGPHLVGANGKQNPTWGFRRRTVCFSGQTFEFDFLLAAVATPLLGMDFLTKFKLSIIPSLQQVLYTASGRTFTKASTSSFISPVVRKPLPPSPHSRHRYNNCSRNSHRCCAPAPPLPNCSMGLCTTSTQVAPPPCSLALGGWTQKNTASPRRNSSPWKKQVLFATQTRFWRPRCTWFPRG